MKRVDISAIVLAAICLGLPAIVTLSDYKGDVQVVLGPLQIAMQSREE